jgi:hypothetical protein
VALASHSMGLFEKPLVLSVESSVRASEREPHEVDDNLYRFEEPVGERHRVEMELLSWHSMHPTERCVAMGEYGPGTSTRACHLPTIYQARHRHRRLGHYHHTWDIVDT